MNVRHWVSDDDGYMAWVHSHPAGYVANLSNRTTVRSSHLKIHRASHRLSDRSNPETVNPWTGNGYTKITADNLEPLLDWIKAKGFVLDKKHYCEVCNPISDTSDVTGFHSVSIEHEANHVESVESIGSITSNDIVSDSGGSFDPHSVEDARKWINASIVRRQGQGKFRTDVLAAYGNRCAISACDVPEALEAAHIFGYLGAETNVVTNGILLRGDLHGLYDLGLIAVDPASMQVVIAPKLVDSDYGYLAGKSVRMPYSAGKHPSQVALKLHAEWAAASWK